MSRWGLPSFLETTLRYGEQFCFCRLGQFASIPGISAISIGHSRLLRWIIRFARGYSIVLGAGCAEVGFVLHSCFKHFELRSVSCFKRFDLRGEGGRPPLLPGAVVRRAALRPGARVARLSPTGRVAARIALLLPCLPQLLLLLLLPSLSPPTILQIPHAGVTTTKQAPNPHHN